MREFSSTGRGGKDRRAIGGGKLGGAGQEVCVQVRVSGKGDRQPADDRGSSNGPQVPAGVDDECAAVAQVDQIGAVA